MCEWSLIECGRLVSGSGGIRRARGLVLRIRVGCDRALVSGKGAYGSCGRRACVMLSGDMFCLF